MGKLVWGLAAILFDETATGDVRGDLDVDEADN
jgi:hypothetical protein